MNTTVRDIIKTAGGPDKIAARSQSTLKPIGADAVHKWRRNGIPDEHWPIFIEQGIPVEEIYRANQKLRDEAVGTSIHGPQP